MKAKIINEDAIKQHKKQEEYEIVKLLIKANKHKRVDRRLKVIQLHLEGKTAREIADKLDYSERWVRQLYKEYSEKGLYEYARHKYGGNHRGMSFAEEEEILHQFDERAIKGEIVTVSEIKKAFDKKRGKDTGRGYIYMLLERHEYRKIKPRTKHPKKASEAEIKASKKLT